MMRERYSEKRVVSCYEADANHNLRAAAMLDMMQEAAGRDATQLGFGYDDMIKSNTAWVLSRLHLIFENYPKWREEVILKTWHKGAARIFYLRDFLLCNSREEVMVRATTSWLIIDLATRRMVRNQYLAENFNNSEMGYALEQPADKIVIPQDSVMEPAGIHKVVWSDIDTNNHVNNVKYAVWAIDAMDYNDAKERVVKEMVINFDSEVLPGSEVRLYRCRVEEEGALTYYIQGKVEDKNSFSIKVILQER